MAYTDEWNEKKDVENHVIEQLKGLGYLHHSGLELEHERSSYHQVTLEGRLETALRRLNPWLDESNLNKVKRTITIQHLR